MQTVKKLLTLMTRGERRKLIPLVLSTLVMSGLEVVGISSLGPFMAVVADPSIVFRNEILSTVYVGLGLESPRAFLVAMGIAVFCIVLIATATKIVVFYLIYRYVSNRQYSLGSRLFDRYLHQPYSFFLSRNTSELSKNLLTEVDAVVNGVLRPLMDILSKGLLALAILVFLIVANPVVALAASGVFGLLYGIIYGAVKPRLMRHGEDMRDSNRLRFKATGEAFGAVKEVKILGKEPFFSSQYSHGAMRFARTQAAKQILSTLPGYAMQSMSLGFAIALVIVMLASHDSLGEVLPLLAIYAVAVQRMMPNLQAVFTGIAQIRYYGHTVDALYADMLGTVQDPQTDSCDDAPLDSHRRPFRRQLSVRNLTFAYPGAHEPVLRDVSLTVRRNTTVGLVGMTGCGKTTLVDVIMGLHSVPPGTIQVDDEPLAGPIGDWQRNFGYVPQQIYLADDTIEANIAFGYPEEYRDPEAVIGAATVANLDEFVTQQLEHGYGTVAGERGVRLSGGQRQRIGIARALYHDPDILVLDEATSALDSVTEGAVMDAIDRLSHRKTIIIIAHRITTVKVCDEIFLLEAGRIVDQGTYADLMERSARFRAMAKHE